MIACAYSAVDLAILVARRGCRSLGYRLHLRQVVFMEMPMIDAPLQKAAQTTALCVLSGLEPFAVAHLDTQYTVRS